uniref:histidine kinase n=1 Tax=uncultured bacterium UPO57 TaxID=1776980 RepID=A0A126SYJ9_9BACT|nr:sensor histidine kinase [uncultured bacterium UPO57]
MADGAGKRRRRGARFALSRLTVTIILANLIGVVILLLGSFGLTQYRDGLIQAKLEGVRAQAQIIADILAQVAIDESSCQPVEADEAEEAGAMCSLSLSEGDVREVFNRVWDSFEGRVRIFNAPQSFENPPVKDASSLLIEDVVLRRDRIVMEALPPLEGAGAKEYIETALERFYRRLSDFLAGGFRRDAARRTLEAELNEALASSPFADDRGAASVRLNENGELVASVSVPIRKVQAIFGVVTAEIGGIDDLVAETRRSILPFFGLACTAAILSSLLLTAAIAQPIRQLALASDRVREGISVAGRARIPDFSNRRDEIGELSAALRAMTQTIYARIDTIESFAADVAHELKNPLTSIRSAIETLDIATSPEARAKLMGVIKKDVARMDRLITDISNASRLDAELARQSREAVDLRKLIADIVDSYGTTMKDGEARVRFESNGPPVYLFGNPSALGQVIRNLIDNARSFSPKDGEVRVYLETPTGREGVARVYVDDDGPGVPPDALDAIFKRFYTKRPAGAAFGDNSGLGLAICRQIVTAHGGSIHAENRLADPGDPQSARLGARFVVELPAA